jgi:hypothetical protein
VFVVSENYLISLVPLDFFPAVAAVNGLWDETELFADLLQWVYTKTRSSYELDMYS